ncbi:MAG: EAL domain-containing protein [Burkholderiaceae bacterium]|nr:EAL domain-containing protein [Burkholderiaceae bacterium]
MGGLTAMINQPPDRRPATEITMINILFRSFENRIVVFFTVLLVAVQLIAYLVISGVGESLSRRDFAARVDAGERALARNLDRHAAALAASAAALGMESGLRNAVATGEPAAIRRMLQSLGIDQDHGLAMLVDGERRLLGDAGPGLRKGSALPIPATSLQLLSVPSDALSLIDGKLRHVVAIPVYSTAPAIWLVHARAIDDRFAEDLRDATDLHFSVVTEHNDRQWRVAASTLPPQARENMTPEVRGLLRAQATNAALELGDGRYQTRSLNLAIRAEERVIAVWQKPMEAEPGLVGELQRTMLDLALASILTSLFGSIVIGRRLVSPINELAAIARRARSGDYSGKAESSRSDEIGELASGFNYLSDTLTARDSKIVRLAYLDGLTGLPNRKLFSARLESAIKSATDEGYPVSVLMLDLDRFKNINDALGHPVGDRVLHAVAERLRGAVRKTDILARLGGDEFAVVLPGTAVAAAREIAAQIITALETPVTVDGQPVDVRTSIGIACAPEHGTDAYTVLRHADNAMYAAKKGNRGCSVFEPGRSGAPQKYLTLLGELRRAVENDELVLYFQPKVDLKTGTTTQAEALVRWNHPQRGLIPPGDFIPFAEQTGFIRVITRWVIRRAIRQCGEWQAQGIRVAVSVNICTRDLLDGELAQLVGDDLAQAGVDAKWLCMEITENSVMEEPARSLDTLLQLHQLGVKLSIDDYGTGYSSLSYVRKLPVGELKIDQSFVRTMSTDSDDAMIVKSTIELGHNMGMQVVAEGVEDLAILALLKQMGCDCAQGYCVSKPLPAGPFALWLAANPVFGDPTIPPARLALRWNPAPQC